MAHVPSGCPANQDPIRGIVVFKTASPHARQCASRTPHLFASFWLFFGPGQAKNCIEKRIMRHPVRLRSILAAATPKRGTGDGVAGRPVGVTSDRA